MEEIEEIIDMIVDEKIGCQKYREMANETDNMEIKKMFDFMANQENDHYRMLKEYLEKYIK